MGATLRSLAVSSALLDGEEGSNVALGEVRGGRAPPVGDRLALLSNLGAGPVLLNILIRKEQSSQMCACLKYGCKH